MAKRARERSRQEQKVAKRERREQAAAASESAEDGPDEAALMEEFRVLSESHAAGNISDEILATERHRIFVELGIESD